MGSPFDRDASGRLFPRRVKIRQRGIDRLAVVHVVQFEMDEIDWDTEGAAEHVERLIKDVFARKFPGVVQDPFVEVDRDQ